MDSFQEKRTVATVRRDDEACAPVALVSELVLRPRNNLYDDRGRSIMGSFLFAQEDAHENRSSEGAVDSLK